MISLTQTKNVKGHAGEPISTGWQSLEEIVKLRRGQLALVVAPPGVGKSVFAVSACIRSGARALYFSADSDAVDQTTRVASILTGKKADPLKEEIVAGNIPDVVGTCKISFSFDTSPTIDDIEQEIEAYYQVNLQDPEIVVVDNVTNVLNGSQANEEDPFGGLEATMDWLNGVARKTGALVLALHHVKSEYNDANRPVPLSGIKGQIARVPQVALTLHKRPKVTEFAPASLVVSVVKNRGGKADPSGNLSADLSFDEDHIRITDWK